MWLITFGIDISAELFDLCDTLIGTHIIMAEHDPFGIPCGAWCVD